MILRAYHAFVALAHRMLSNDLLSLVTRLGVAGVFFMSGRSKVDGILHITDGTYSLFQEDYKLPLIDPDFAAHLATYSEHLFSILLVLGLFTRLSALAFLGMTAVIEIFVYPAAWPTHLSWAALLLFLIAKGGGRFSLDRIVRIP
ncbi:MAG: DoxX family protein [Alphaproteobacteria bacterium]